MTTRSFDVGVFGATASGVLAAIAAAQAGMRTVLVEPGRHVGGMVSGGLGRTDMDRQENIIGGLARRFFEQVGAHYGQPVAWRFEPSVARAVLERWLDEARVEVQLGVGRAQVETAGARIVGLRAGNRNFAAEVWIDASYEGDLLAGAGVSYAIGREGRARYGESLGGRQELLPNAHQFRRAVPARAADGGLLPGVQPYAAIGLPGDGDGRIQSYCFRLCLTSEPGGLAIEPAPGYTPERYELAARYLHALGDDANIRDFMGIAELPGGKVDVNSGGPVSTNLLGGSWPYPEAGAAERAAIREDHLAWAQGLLHFLGNDRRVPAGLRREVSRYHLPRDEFAATGHWPPQLYVREARRMVGEYVLTQHDLESRRTKYDPIGMGGYNVDIREVQWVAAPISRFPDIYDEVLVEGYLSAPVEPYQIPYRALLPPADECANLLVSGCISASHVAYSSFRMEPQFMICGHSAGVAAALALRSGVGPHRVPLAELQTELERQGQILRR